MNRIWRVYRYNLILKCSFIWTSL